MVKVLYFLCFPVDVSSVLHNLKVLRCTSVLEFSFALVKFLFIICFVGTLYNSYTVTIKSIFLFNIYFNRLFLYCEYFSMFIVLCSCRCTFFKKNKALKLLHVLFYSVIDRSIYLLN